MKTYKKLKKGVSMLCIGLITFTTNSPLIPNITFASSSEKVIYPLKEISKLECRFTEFDELKSNCKQDLPILKTKYYKKYAAKDGGYNDYTRLYTVLWGSSYKYGWDVGNGGHMGVDIATAKGTPVYAMAEGTVIIAEDLGMLGNSVSIEHKINGKKVISNYSHLSKINTKAGTKVLVGEKIGEVGSTGNSTGNHLHFQIDLSNASFTPAYYEYNSCPYSYYEISEKGVCFNELEKITIDPLKFLETSGAVLDNYKTTEKITIGNNDNKDTTKNETVETSIFSKTVYIGYSSGDTREVQRIYKALGYYKGKINGDYEDVLESVIDYQIDKGVIKTKNSDGAGRFGPKTRAQTKIDYNSYLAAGGDTEKVYVTVPKNTTVTIDKKDLLTREEIEAREVNEFIKDYNIDLKFAKTGKSSVGINETETLKLTITNKRGKYFKGNMPGGMTFGVNTEKLSVFPTKLYYFTDGKRDIKLTGLKEGTTSLYIKIGTVTVKTFDIKIYNGNKTIYPESASLYMSSSMVLGETKTAIGVFKDDSNNNLINLEFGSTYKLKATEGNQVCIKKGDLKNISKIYRTACSKDDYKNELTFNYSDTIGGLLVFDYKALNKDFEVNIINTYNNNSLGEKDVSIKNPKGLTNTYAYKTEVIEMLEKGVVEGINQGYFQEDKELTEQDGLNWIKNALEKISDDNFDSSLTKKINTNLAEVNLNLNTASKYQKLTRKEFLALSYKYLVIDENNSTVTINYKDLETFENEIVSNVLGNNTWKDQFGDSYFQPNEHISRGETAYLLSKLFETNNNTYLTLN